jgi:hypothetical protein
LCIAAQLGGGSAAAPSLTRGRKFSPDEVIEYSAHFSHAEAGKSVDGCPLVVKEAPPKEDRPDGLVVVVVVVVMAAAVALPDFLNAIWFRPD